MSPIHRLFCRTMAILLSAVFLFLFFSTSVSASIQLVTDGIPGPPSSIIYNVIKQPDYFYYTSNDTEGTTLQRRIWKSNGTASGTRVIGKVSSTLNDPFDGATISVIGVYKGRFFFAFDDGVRGKELWVCDTNESGAKLFLDITEGEKSSSIGSRFDAAVFNGKLFFSANKNLWVTDGSPANTKAIFQGLLAPSNLVVAGDNLFFISMLSFESGEELFVLNSDADSPQLVKDINPKSNRDAEIYHMVPFGDRVIFSAIDGVHGRELWVSGGAVENTRMIKDINPGSSSSIYLGDPAPVVFNGKAYFSATNGANGYEPWVTGGSEATTQMVQDAHPGSESGWKAFSSYVPGENILYTILQNNNTEKRLWSKRQTEETFTMSEFAIADIRKGITLGDTIYLPMTDGEYGNELFQISAASSEPKLVADLNPGYEFSSPGELFRFKDCLYFQAATPSTGTELYMYNPKKASHAISNGRVKSRVLADFAVRRSSGQLNLSFRLEKATLVAASVYNFQGRQLHKISARLRPAGIHTIQCPATSYGTFIVNIMLDGHMMTHRIVGTFGK